MTNYQMTREFTRAFRQPLDEAIPKKETLELAFKLIEEEFCEVGDEFDNLISKTGCDEDVTDEDKAKLLKELCDLVFVCHWAAATQGFEFDKAYEAVWKSNMSKLDDDGNPIYREDGKVLKSHNYKPANVMEWV